VEMYQNPFYRWLRATVIALLRQLERGGEIRSALDLECAADSLLAALNIELYLYQRRGLGMGRGLIVAAPGLCAERDVGCRAVGAGVYKAAHGRVRCSSI
jgi:hypothetical protein